MELQRLVNWLMHSFYATHKKPFANKVGRDFAEVDRLKTQGTAQIPPELHSGIALLVENDFLLFARIDSKKVLVHVDRTADWRRMD